MQSILEGIRIIDWTHWHSGPYGPTMLADLGAEVIKIEHPKGGDEFRFMHPMFGVPMTLPNGRHVQFEDINRNKKGMSLDVSTPKGREITYQLVEKSDVFVTNYRGADRAGLDYETLSRLNPRLIYATCTGSGTKGPDREIGSYEIMCYARSGAMFASGDGADPVYITPGLGDRTSAVFLAFGLMSALMARERHGIGQQLTVSQLNSMLHLQGTSVSAQLLGGREFDHGVANRIYPLYNWYRCKDDRWIAFGMDVSIDKYWTDFCTSVGVPDLQNDPRFADPASRMENAQTLISIVDELFATRTSEEWLAALHKSKDLIYSIVNRISDLANDPQVVANDMITEWDHPDLGPRKFVGFPVEFSETPARFTRAAPHIGEHTSEILQDLLGYSGDEIPSLRESGVI